MKGYTIDCKYVIRVSEYMPLRKPRKKLDIPVISIEVPLWEQIQLCIIVSVVVPGDQEHFISW